MFGRTEPKSGDLPALHLPVTAPGFELVRAAQWGMALVIGGAVVSAGWFWWDSRGLEEEASRYEQAKQRMLESNRRFVEQASLAGINLSEDRINTLPREVAFANQLLEQRAFSWTRFLSDLEEAVPPRISISSVTMNFKDKTITLNGMALTLKDLTALLASLESHPAFKEVVLAQHRLQEEEAEAGPAALGKETVKPINFSLSVIYRPPS